MNRTLASKLCIAGIALAAAGCSSPAAKYNPTATPTQLVVSTPFTLPAGSATGSTAVPVPDRPTNAVNGISTPLPTHRPSYSKTLFVTQPPSSTQAASFCDQAAPGNPIDVTIPDYTELQPGEHFIKTWRLVNSGPCTWSDAYAAVWFSGEMFEASQVVPFTGEVPTGKSVDITVDMIAPELPGSYQSNWKLSNDRGELFGIGPAGDAPIWVRIVVVAAVETEVPTASSQTPTPAVLVSGLVSMLPGEGVDLDTNRLSAPDSSDLIYQKEVPGKYLISVAPGVKVSELRTSQPGFTDCSPADLTGAAITVDTSSLGGFFCFRTSLGLPGWGRLVLLDDTTGSLTLETLTWNTP